MYIVNKKLMFRITFMMPVEAMLPKQRRNSDEEKDLTSYNFNILDLTSSEIK